MRTVILTLCLFGFLPLLGCHSGYAGRPSLRTVSSRRPALPPRPTIADKWTSTKIRGKLLCDYLVDSKTITVQTVSGVVTLRGFVPSPIVRKRALTLARETEGVRQVVSELRVVRSRTY